MSALSIRNIVTGTVVAVVLALAGCSSGFSCTEKNPCTGAAPSQADIDQCNAILNGACGSQYKALGDCAQNNLTCSDGGSTISSACQSQEGSVISCCFSNLSACSTSTDGG